MALATQVESYLKRLEKVRRATPATVMNYRSTLTAFARKHSQLTPAAVESFVASYAHPSSANSALTRLRGLADFLDISLDSVPRAKEVVKDPEALSSTEMDRLLGSAADLDKEIGFAVTLLGHTGLRIHEFYGLAPDSLQMREDVPFLSILGKGQKLRRVPLDELALAAFRSLHLPFIMPMKRFREYLAEAGRNAGIPFHVNPHKLRSSFASILMNEKKADSAFVAKICGWSRVDTMVNRYFKPDLARLHSVL